MFSRRLFAGLLLGVMLAGCAAPQVPQATLIPTPQVWRVSYSSELGWLLPAMGDCMPPGAGLAVNETQTLDPTADVILHWGDIDPQGRAAYEIGRDSLTVIVHPENPLSDLTASQLRDVYGGGIRDWSELDGRMSGGVQAWAYPDGLAVESLFASSLTGDSLGESVFLAPDVPAMLTAVGDDPLAIGFVPAQWLLEGVKTIPVSGWAPGDEPVLMLIMGEIPVDLQDWSGCLMELIH